MSSALSKELRGKHNVRHTLNEGLLTIPESLLIRLVHYRSVRTTRFELFEENTRDVKEK